MFPADLAPVIEVVETLVDRDQIPTVSELLCQLPKPLLSPKVLSDLEVPDVLEPALREQKVPLDAWLNRDQIAEQPKKKVRVHRRALLGRGNRCRPGVPGSMLHGFPRMAQCQSRERGRLVVCARFEPPGLTQLPHEGHDGERIRRVGQRQGECHRRHEPVAAAGVQVIETNTEPALVHAKVGIAHRKRPRNTDSPPPELSVVGSAHPRSSASGPQGRVVSRIDDRSFPSAHGVRTSIADPDADVFLDSPRPVTLRPDECAPRITVEHAFGEIDEFVEVLPIGLD